MFILILIQVFSKILHKYNHIQVNLYILGRLIGKAGKTIDEIKNKSMVNKIIRRNKSDVSLSSILNNLKVTMYLDYGYWTKKVYMTNFNFLCSETTFLLC